MTFLLSLLTGGLGFLKRLPWPVFAALGALAAVWALWHAHTSAVTHARSDGFAAGRADATATFVAAQAKADDLQRQHVAIVEAAHDRITEEKTVALEDHLASARADAARYADRLRRASQAHPGIADKGHLPEAKAPAGAAAGASETSVMDDAEACAIAVVKAEDWQDWFLTEPKDAPDAR